MLSSVPLKLANLGKIPAEYSNNMKKKKRRRRNSIRQNPTSFNLTTVDGKDYVVLFMNREGTTHHCPFCGYIHHHEAEGLQKVKCTSKYTKKKLKISQTDHPFELVDCYKDDGYYLAYEDTVSEYVDLSDTSF